MKVIIDSRFYNGSDSHWRDVVIQECKSRDIGIMFTDIRQKGKIHSSDLITAIGIGCDISMLILTIISLLVKPKEKVTYKKFLDEIEALLKLNGISNFKIKSIDGLENLNKKNSLPCIINIQTENGETFFIYTGFTGELIIVSPIEYNYKDY